MLPDCVGEAPAETPGDATPGPAPAGIAIKTAIKTRRPPLGDAEKAKARKLYEGSTVTQTEIAASVGISPASLTRMANREGWVRAEGARRSLALGRIRARIEAEIEAVESVMASGGLEAADRAARTLANLVKSLRELQRYDSERPKAEPDDEDGRPPADLDALRDALADRLARFQQEGE